MNDRRDIAEAGDGGTVTAKAVKPTTLSAAQEDAITQLENAEAFLIRQGFFLFRQVRLPGASPSHEFHTRVHWPDDAEPADRDIAVIMAARDLLLDLSGISHGNYGIPEWERCSVLLNDLRSAEDRLADLGFHVFRHICRVRDCIRNEVSTRIVWRANWPIPIPHTAADAIRDIMVDWSNGTHRSKLVWQEKDEA